MADWKDGLTPKKDWEKDLVPLSPQGTAPPTDSYVAGPMSTGDKMGTLANMLSTGTAGAQLGAFLGIPGAIAGGALGAGAGLMLPPSETPGTDIGATAGDLAASFLTKGLSNTGRRLLRIGADTAGTGLGALLGAGVDKATGRVTETPIGRVIMYPALSTPGAILKSLATDATPAAEAASRLAQNGYGQAPLSFSEQTGLGGALEKMVSRGTQRAADLGAAQDTYGRDAMQKIVGADLNQFTDILMRGRELGGEAQGIMNDWEKQWQKLNPGVTVTKQVPSSVIDPSTGKPMMKTISSTTKAPPTNWGQFMADFNLNQDEFNYLRRAVTSDPDSFLNNLMPQGENPTYNLVKVRALMKVFDGKPEAGQLGQAYTFRLLGSPMQNGEAINATELAKRIKANIGSPTEPGALVAAVGPDRAAALNDLATVLEKAVPLDKMAQEGTSMQKRGGSYLFHKIAFTAASGGAAQIMSGGMSAPSWGHVLIGAGAGSVVAIGFPTVVSMVMMNPKMGQVWKEAAQGSGAAVSRILRTIGSTTTTAIDKGYSADDYGPTAAKSRLEGLFGIQ